MRPALSLARPGPLLAPEWAATPPGSGDISTLVRNLPSSWTMVAMMMMMMIMIAMMMMMMMIISYLTCPVCPCGTPARGGGAASLVVVRVMGGTVRVTMTPAEVPTHSMSLTARSEVTRRHAVLCCRMISSQ